MNEFSGAPYSDQTNWTYSHYPNQIGQSGDGVILLVAERFSIAAQHRSERLALARRRHA
jgi:monoamine oxidase